MQLSNFLKQIITPFVNSIGSISLSELKSQEKLRSTKSSGMFRGSQKNSSSSVHRKLNLVNDKSLECIKPFYTNNRNKSLSIHGKDLQKAQFDRKERKTCNPNLNKSQLSLHEFGKKREVGDKVQNIRKQLAKQKRNFSLNFKTQNQKFSYGKIFQDHTHHSMIQIAQMRINHKFCRLIGNVCAGKKCKLDCFNKKFQEFLQVSNQTILKNLDEIIGRQLNFVNYDEQIQKQILSFIQSNQNKIKIEDLLQKLSEIKEFMIQQKGKFVSKKYINWAKNMYNVYHSKERQTTKSRTQSVKQKDKTYIFKNNLHKDIKNKTNVFQNLDIKSNLKKNIIRKQETNTLLKNHKTNYFNSNNFHEQKKNNNKQIIKKQNQNNFNFILEEQQKKKKKNKSVLNHYSSQINKETSFKFDKIKKESLIRPPKTKTVKNQSIQQITNIKQTSSHNDNNKITKRIKFLFPDKNQSYDKPEDLSNKTKIKEIQGKINHEKEKQIFDKKSTISVSKKFQLLQKFNKRSKLQNNDFILISKPRNRKNLKNMKKRTVNSEKKIKSQKKNAFLFVQKVVPHQTLQQV